VSQIRWTVTVAASEPGVLLILVVRRLRPAISSLSELRGKFRVRSLPVSELELESSDCRTELEACQ
jgi:hypothetical protein